MVWFRRDRHVCSQVTAGEVDAVVGAAAAVQRYNETVAMGPMIDSLVDSLAEMRERNHFADRIRSALKAVEGE
jgi:hypothetical protein